MTRKTRRILFICALVIFFAASYVVLLYAQGYRYSLTTHAFTRTGAIYVKTNTSADVLLDGKPATSTSFLTDTASVDGLLPGSYTITVQKSDYFSWQKKVTVQEGFVQDYGHIILLPRNGTDKDNVITEIKDLLYPPVASSSVTPTPAPSKTPKPTIKPSPSPSPTPDTSDQYFIDKGALYVQNIDGTGPAKIADGINSVYKSPDGAKIAWFVDNQLWVYWLSDTNYQPYHKAGDIIFLARFNNPIKSAAWFRDSDHLAVDAPLRQAQGEPASASYRIVETDTRSGVNIVSY